MKTPLFSSRRNHRYPYGLTFADAGKGVSLQPYKFGGKELDAMYGLNIYDFHARTRTPDLARFTRPDPLAEKTPHLSPYLFCANDPVNNIDPTGMEVWFNDFMYTPGCEYFGDDDFVRRSVQAMNIVYQSGGDKLIDDLVASESKYSFVPGQEGESYTTGNQFGDARIYLNQALDKNGFISAVAHESMHVGQFLNGQGGQSIFNEVEAYAFEAVTSNNSLEQFETRFAAQGTQGKDTIAGVFYYNSMNALSFEYSQKNFVYSIMSFRPGAQVYNPIIYGNYPMLTPNFNFKSILLQYYPWRE